MANIVYWTTGRVSATTALGWVGNPSLDREMPTQTVQKHCAIVNLVDIQSAIEWLQTNMVAAEYHIRGVAEEQRYEFRVTKTIKSAKIVFKCPEKALLFRRRAVLEDVYTGTA